MPEPDVKLCKSCGELKPLGEFYLSQRRVRRGHSGAAAHSLRCIACNHLAKERDSGLNADILVPSLVALYEEILVLMENIGRASFEELVKSEWDEQAMRKIMQGLVIRAASGDSVAAKLIIDTRMRLRAEGDGSEEDIINLAQLLASDPLQTGGDTA